MAHAAKINTLTDELVRSIASQDGIVSIDEACRSQNPKTAQHDERYFVQARQTATKAFRSNTHLRVNHFDVRSRLEGLEEKFRIINNEPLADALRIRLDELAKVSTRYTPDILSLLLSLSDRPLEKTRLKDATGKTSSPKEPALTWAEIIADDPLSEQGIWDDIEATSDSSDASFERELNEVTVSTEASSINEDDFALTAQAHVIAADHEAFHSIRAAQRQLETGTGKVAPSQLNIAARANISELLAIRECIFMLRGVPTQLFGPSHTVPEANVNYKIATLATFTSRAVLDGFAAIGGQIGQVRRWCKQPQSASLLQRCQAAIEQRLSAFSKQVFAIEQDLVAPVSETVVSIQDVICTVEDLTGPLLRINVLLQGLQTDCPPWQLLDHLYKECCELQITLDNQKFLYFATLFLECLPAYLNHLQSWIRTGTIDDRDSMLFITSSSHKIELGSLWHDRYDLRRDADGEVVAPSFIRSNVARIFSAGKCIMFLDALGHDNIEHQYHQFDLTTMSFDSALSAFPDLVEDELSAWVTALSGPKPTELKRALLFNHGVQRFTESLHSLYLSKDGSVFQSFADSLFDRIDRNPTHWADRYVLSEMVEASFGSLEVIDNDHVSARVLQDKNSRSSTLDQLNRLVIDLHIPWPIQNITREASPLSCQQAFTFLLQTYRAKYVLQRLRLAPRQKAAGAQCSMVQLVNLRHRLTWFVDIVHMHICETAAITLHELDVGIARAADLDSMAAVYAQFQRRLSQRLLLSDNLATIHQAIYTILIVCEDFVIIWAKRTGTSHLSNKNRQVLADDPDVDVTDLATAADKVASPTRSLQQLLSEYDRQLSFAVAGLRGVGRAGGEQAWSTLVNRLGWGQQYKSTG